METTVPTNELNTPRQSGVPLPQWQARLLRWYYSGRYWWALGPVLLAWFIFGGMVGGTRMIASIPFVMVALLLYSGSCPMTCNEFIRGSLRRRKHLALAVWLFSLVSLSCLTVYGVLLSLNIVSYPISATSSPWWDYRDFGLFLLLVLLSAPWQFCIDNRILRRLALETPAPV
jgi:hypothetical protein